MSDAILFRFGIYERMEERADEFLASGTPVDPASLFPPVEQNIVSWDNLSADVVAELMIWENVSDQDLQYLEGLAE